MGRKSNVLSVRLSRELRQGLERLALVEGRDASTLTRELIEAHLRRRGIELEEQVARAAEPDTDAERCHQCMKPLPPNHPTNFCSPSCEGMYARTRRKP